MDLGTLFSHEFFSRFLIRDTHFLEELFHADIFRSGAEAAENLRSEADVLEELGLPLQGGSRNKSTVLVDNVDDDPKLSLVLATGQVDHATDLHVISVVRLESRKHIK